MIVSEIFEGIEGEGSARIGTYQLFLRLFGCCIFCKSCDSKYTWDTPQNRKEAKEMHIRDIFNKINASAAKWVSITGGDPLLQSEEIHELVHLCKHYNLDKKFNIEITGLADNPVLKLVDFISADVKTPSTGVVAQPCTTSILYKTYRDKIQFKAVIADQNDLDFIKCYCPSIPIVLTPCWEPGKELDKDMLQNIQKALRQRPNLRMIVQQHKFLYGASAKSV